MLDSNNNALALTTPAATNGEATASRALIVPPGPPPFVHEGPLVPPGLSSGPTMSALMHGLRRRWILAFSLALLGAASVVLVIMNLMPARYVVTPRMQVSSREQAAVFNEGGHEEDFLAFKSFLVAQLKSPTVLNAALASEEVKKAGVTGVTADDLQTALKPEYKGPGVLEVKLSGDRVEGLAPLANAICRSCIAKLHDTEESKRRVRLQELEKTLSLRRKNLQQDRHSLRLQEAAEKMEDFETAKVKFQSLQGKITVVENKLLNNGIDQNKCQQILRAADGKGLKNATIVLDKDVEEILAKPYKAGGLLKRIEEEDQKIERYIATLKDPREWVEKSIIAKVAILKQVDEMRSSIRKELEEKAVLDAEKQIDSLRKEEIFLKGELRKLDDEAKKINPFRRPENMIIQMKRIEEEDAAIKKMNEKVDLLRMEPLPASRVTLLQEAEEPTSKDFSRHYKLAGAGGVGVFFILLFGVAFLEFRSRRVNGAEEISHGLGINLVGTLPNLPVRARQANPASTQDQLLQNQLTEAVDSIRTLLLHSARTEKLNVVMITSALSGEGKTSLATQLAASLARAWRKTLLVDGDLRNPAGHRLFDLPVEPGFSEVLRGEVTVADAIKPTAVSRLWLMPAGHYDSHALQALAQDGVRKMFEDLKQQYDFIIVDSCPVLPVADALNLGQHVDGVVFAVLRDVSRSPAVYAAQQRLHNLGIRTLGAVVIGETAAATQAYPYPARSA
jgi:succinoglycan biosynthesis transport protein ExoP